MEKRKQFTFYRSYFEAVMDLEKNDQAAVLMAVCAYALDGSEPKLSGPVSAVFKVIRPTLDAGRRKALGAMAACSRKDAGKAAAAGSPGEEGNPQGAGEDTGRMDAGAREETANKKKKEEEGEKEKEIEIEIENECYSPCPQPGRDDAFAAFWQAYPRKTGRREAQEAWRRLCPGRRAVETIMLGLESWKRTQSWQREGGRYVPSACKWLSDRRWEWCPAPEQKYPSGASGALGQAELEAIRRVLEDKSLEEGGGDPWRRPGEAGT